MIITSLYAALLVVLFIVLSARIIAFRRGKKINLGDGEDEAMRRRIRAQANCAEYAPFGILMIGIAETLSAHPALLHLMGIMLLVGRIMHAYGINSREVPGIYRTGGMVLTLLSLALGAIVNLIAVALGTV